MASIHTYHPNKNNTGFAFKASKDDPTKNVNIKLGQVEVAAILDCLDRNRPFSTMHDGDKQIKSIQFVPWMNKVAEGEKPTQKGYSFSISITDKQDSTSKNSLYIGLTFPEGRLIREFLMFALNKSFSPVVSEVDSI
jgi:Whirly transcription factor